MSKKKLIGSLMLLVILVLVTLTVLLKGNNPQQFIAILGQVKPPYLILAALCALFFPVMEGVNLCHAFDMMGTPVTLFHGIRYACTGFLFSSITPGSSGGQPMQLYDMHRTGHNVTQGLLALLLEFSSFQAAMISVGVLAYIQQANEIQESAGTILPWLLLGLVINGGVLFILLLFLLRPQFIQTIGHLFVRLVSHFSDTKSACLQEKLLEQNQHLKQAVEAIRVHPGKYAIMVLISICQVMVYHSVPYLIGRSLSIPAVHYLTVTGLQAFLYLAVSVVPLPGATGANEGAFYLLYQNIYPTNMLAPALLLTRAVNFYLPLMVSLIIVIINWRKRRT